MFKIICKPKSSNEWKPYANELGLATIWQGFDTREEAEEFISETSFRHENYDYAIMDATPLA